MQHRIFRLQFNKITKIYLSSLATNNTSIEIKILEAKGREKTLPNSLKRKSPGNFPMPNFSSHGKRLANTINAKKIITTQRIILTLLNVCFVFSET